MPPSLPAPSTASLLSESLEFIREALFPTRGAASTGENQWPRSATQPPVRWKMLRLGLVGIGERERGVGCGCIAHKESNVRSRIAPFVKRGGRPKPLRLVLILDQPSPAPE